MNVRKVKEDSEISGIGGDAVAELAVDVYQTDKHLVIQTPIAGVDPDKVDVSIENDMITISGFRSKEEEVEEKDYFYQECYWGGFSKTIALPSNEVNIEEAKAEMKNGVLTIKIPRLEKRKFHKLKIFDKNKD